MSVYNKAHDLARELAASEEYKEYLKAKENMEKDKTNLSILEEYRRKQWEVQMAQLLGQEVDEELLVQLEQIYQILSLNPAINEFLLAEYRFTRMLGDIQKILAESVESWFSVGGYNPMLN